MYHEYNRIYPEGAKGQFTTSLHALTSGITKSARGNVQETVYRGVSGRGISIEDLINKTFLEKGAQSFTTDLNVAKRYAKYAGKDMPSYILVVYEGVIDKGADISAMSFYPYEKEKLYSALAMMECISIRVGGRMIVD